MHIVGKIRQIVKSRGTAPRQIEFKSPALFS
jgi:hypothetical protein